MKKATYATPTMRVRRGGQALMAANSLDHDNPTTGLDNQPGYGGDNDGSHTVGAKPHHYSVWDD